MCIFLFLSNSIAHRALLVTLWVLNTYWIRWSKYLNNKCHFELAFWKTSFFNCILDSQKGIKDRWFEGRVTIDQRLGKPRQIWLFCCLKVKEKKVLLHIFPLKTLYEVWLDIIWKWISSFVFIWVKIKQHPHAYFKPRWKLYLCTHFLYCNISNLICVDLLQLLYLHVALKIVFKEIILKGKVCFSCFNLLVVHTSAHTLFLFSLLSADRSGPTYDDRLETFFPFTMTTPS